MAKATIKLIVLTTQEVLISQIDEVTSELGEPDCKLQNPFIVKGDLVLEPWLLNVTKDDIFMMSSDKIVTLCEPTPTLLEKYLDLTKE